MPSNLTPVHQFKDAFTRMEARAQQLKRDEALSKKRALAVPGGAEQVVQLLGQKAIETFGSQANLSDLFDNDGSGEVDVAEFARAAKSLGFNQEEAKAMFLQMDQDASNSLQIAELDKMHRAEAGNRIPAEEEGELPTVVEQAPALTKEQMDEWGL